MRHFLLALLLLVPSVGWGQNTNTLPPMCTAETLLTTCVPQVQGTIARINDADDTTACVNAFGGSTTLTCQFDGSSWFPISAGGTFLGESADTITNPASGTFMFTNTDGSDIIITCADQTADCTLKLQNGGTNPVEIGVPSSETTTRIGLYTDGLRVQVDEAQNTLTLQAHDTGSVILDFRDYADTADDDMAHGIISANCATATTGAEDCDLTISTTEAGSNETRITIVGDGDIDFSNSDVKIVAVESSAFGAPNEMTADRTVLNQYLGIPKLNVTHTAAFANGTTNVAVAAPLKATCSAIVNGAEVDDTTNFITTISSYKYTWAADVAEDDGIDCVIGGRAVNDITHLGFWFRTDIAIASGDIDINFDDGGVTDGTHSTFATAVLAEWHWVELNITAACSGECSEIDGIEFLATAQADAATTLDGVVMNIDQLAVWKDADETAIGDIQVGGLIDLSYAPVAAGSDNTQTQGTEWTHFFINYQTGADAVVPITNLSTEYGTTLEVLN